MSRTPLLPWRFALASSLGTSHAAKRMPCQDAGVAQVIVPPGSEPVFLAVSADGAGSARRADVGADLACRLVCREITSLLQTGAPLAGIDRERVEDILLHLQIDIAVRAQADGCQPREYASTLIAAVVGPDAAVYFQVGDGAIVVRTGGEPPGYHCIFWPAHGERDNFTFFATEPHAADRLEWRLVPGRVEEIALFTDGLERLALQPTSRMPRASFFDPLFASLRTAPDTSLAALSASIAEFLDSPEVNQSTRDDKTLILATRRRHPPPLGLEHVE